MITRNDEVSLSVIIPVGPGDEAWRGLPERLAEMTPATEIIISAARPQPHDWPDKPDAAMTWLSGPAGRARQLNAGIAKARGEWLWLVHADCRPSRQALARAAECVRCDCASLYYFDLEFLDDGPAATRLNAHGANLRARWFGLPFGDQALLMPRRLAERLGGFDESLSHGEDQDFVVRARAAGMTVERLPAGVAASARRYRSHGWLATTARHARLTVKLWLGARRRVRNAADRQSRNSRKRRR